MEEVSKKIIYSDIVKVDEGQEFSITLVLSNDERGLGIYSLSRRLHTNETKWGWHELLSRTNSDSDSSPRSKLSDFQRIREGVRLSQSGICGGFDCPDVGNCQDVG